MNKGRNASFWGLLFLMGLVSAALVAGPFDENVVKQVPVVKPDGTAVQSVLKNVPSGFHVRVAGYNIAHARGNKSGGLNEIGRRKNLKGIISLLKDNAIDVVGLTEISKGDLRSGCQNQPEDIAKGLGKFHQVYAENVTVGWFGFLATQGNAIVSRYPIQSHVNHPLYRTSKKHEQRSCLEALIDLGKNRKLRVFVAHLSLVAEESEKQIQEIFGWVQASQEPVILVGDFNSRPKSGRVKWLAERMTDTSSNLNTTYLNKPDVKIDYHFTSGNVKSGKARVTGFEEGYSDHGCLINDYELPE